MSGLRGQYRHPVLCVLVLSPLCKLPPSELVPSELVPSELVPSELSPGSSFCGCPYPVVPSHYPGIFFLGAQQ